MNLFKTVKRMTCKLTTDRNSRWFCWSPSSVAVSLSRSIGSIAVNLLIRDLVESTCADSFKWMIVSGAIGMYLFNSGPSAQTGAKEAKKGAGFPWKTVLAAGGSILTAGVLAVSNVGRALVAPIAAGSALNWLNGLFREEPLITLNLPERPGLPTPSIPRTRGLIDFVWGMFKHCIDMFSRYQWPEHHPPTETEYNIAYLKSCIQQFGDLVDGDREAAELVILLDTIPRSVGVGGLSRGFDSVATDDQHYGKFLKAIQWQTLEMEKSSNDFYVNYYKHERGTFLHETAPSFFDLANTIKTSVNGIGKFTLTISLSNTTIDFMSAFNVVAMKRISRAAVGASLNIVNNTYGKDIAAIDKKVDTALAAFRFNDQKELAASVKALISLTSPSQGADDGTLQTLAFLVVAVMVASRVKKLANPDGYSNLPGQSSLSWLSWAVLVSYMDVIINTAALVAVRDFEPDFLTGAAIGSLLFLGNRIFFAERVQYVDGRLTTMVGQQAFI